MTNQYLINQNMKNISNSFKLHKGCSNINTGNTLIHELAKTKLLYLLKKRGRIVYSEITFSNGSRADLYCPEVEECIEIVMSETEKSKKNKENNYPGFIYFYNAEEVLREDFDI